jgi:hypothetical protein
MRELQSADPRKEAFGEDRLCSVLTARLSNASFGLVFLASAIAAHRLSGDLF